MASYKALSKKPRGSYNYRCDDKVVVCKWNDNSVFNILSNYFTYEPIHKANRRMKQQTNATIDMPFLMKQYNQGMGGVDVIDRLLGSYRPAICEKKWYFPLVTNAINVSIVAAWRLH